MRSRGVSKATTPIGTRWVVWVLLALITWGCKPCPPCPECPDASLGVASTDPTVTVITIGADLAISPLAPVISKGGGGGVQWHNAGSELTTVILVGSPVAIELAGGSYSRPYRLTESVSPGQTIDYTVKRGLGGPPDPPSVVVGP